jgi:SAM-dependent methyltransferase
VRPVPPTGHWHRDYEQGRPGWPAEVVDIAGLHRSAEVLEVGAGTGKLTRLLVAHFGRVIAVEPDQEMRRILESLCPDADVRAGSAEAIPLSAASVDAVIAAEAFHWFDGERALLEFKRVLRPGGAVIMMWNVPAGPSDPPTTDVDRLLTELAPPRDELGHDPVDLNADRFSSMAWQAPFAGSSFEPLQELALANPQTLDREALIAFYESMGWLGDLPDDQRLPLLERVRSLLPADEYRRPWQARVFWTRLQPSEG